MKWFKSLFSKKCNACARDCQFKNNFCYGKVKPYECIYYIEEDHCSYPFREKKVRHLCLRHMAIEVNIPKECTCPYI